MREQYRRGCPIVRCDKAEAAPDSTSARR
jgi:hypothetical protein